MRCGGVSRVRRPGGSAPRSPRHNRAATGAATSGGSRRRARHRTHGGWSLPAAEPALRLGQVRLGHRYGRQRSLSGDHAPRQCAACVGGSDVELETCATPRDVVARLHPGVAHSTTTSPVSSRWVLTPWTSTVSSVPGGRRAEAGLGAQQDPVGRARRAPRTTACRPPETQASAVSAVAPALDSPDRPRPLSFYWRIASAAIIVTR